MGVVKEKRSVVIAGFIWVEERKRAVEST